MIECTYLGETVVLHEGEWDGPEAVVELLNQISITRRETRLTLTDVAHFQDRAMVNELAEVYGIRVVRDNTPSTPAPEGSEPVVY